MDCASLSTGITAHRSKGKEWTETRVRGKWGTRVGAEVRVMGERWVKCYGKSMLMYDQVPTRP